MIATFPKRRLNIAHLFFDEVLEEAKKIEMPSRNDIRWKNKEEPIEWGIRIAWVKTPKEVKLAFYFRQYPQWYEIEYPELIEDVQEYILFDKQPE